MYYGARYYDPALSRFITPDTMYDRGPQGLNRYSYALNNPIRYNDPSGHFINGQDGEQDPDGYGTVTGSSEQITDGTATVHDGGDGEFTQTLNEFSSGGYLTFPMDPANFKSPYPYKETSDAGLTIIHVGVSVLFEPYDWASTFYGWRQGEFSYWDLAGLAPFVSGAAAKKIGAARVDLVTKFFKKNRVAAYTAARTFEFHSNFTRKTFRVNKKKYSEYLNADSILLGRFYGDMPLDYFGQWFVPQATLMTGDTGYGKYLVENIQRVIDNTNHIYMRGEGISEGLDKLSFTYRHELGYIRKNVQLIDKTTILDEYGVELPLREWLK